MKNSSILYGAIDTIREKTEKSRPLSLSELPVGRTALIIVDMVNGFVKEGALYSPNIEKINEPVAKLALRCEAHGIPVTAFCDSHTESSAEFSAFPAHCIADSAESRLTEEISSCANITLFPKNSTNGYLQEDFQSWLSDNREIDCFIIVGCCTDLCVQQFALTLKAHFNKADRESRVIVPASMVATYDMAEHNAELCTLMALYNMKINSVEIVSDII